MNQAISSTEARTSTSVAAIVLLWLSRTSLGLLAAYPLLSAIAATGIGDGPDRDAVLFQPGSLLLFEGLRVGMPWLGAALRSTLLASALCAVAELLPLAFALDLLRGEERSLSQRTLRAAQCFPRFLGLGAIAVAAQGVLLLGASLLDAALKASLQAADERLLSVAPLSLFALALLASLWLSGVQDVARAAVVERDLSARAALVRALTLLRSDPLSVWSGPFAAAAAALLGYLTAAWLTTKQDLTGPSGVPIALCFAIHQLAILFGIAWRVRWLARALSLSAAVRGSAGD